MFKKIKYYWENPWKCKNRNLCWYIIKSHGFLNLSFKNKRRHIITFLKYSFPIENIRNLITNIKYSLPKYKRIEKQNLNQITRGLFLLDKLKDTN